MALNITYGNDIQLRLLVTRDSVPFPIDLATEVQVNIVSIFNRRIPLEFQISDSAVYVTVKALPIGTYGIEVNGLLNKFNWRTYADAAIVVTSATKAGDTSITVASDAYDVTMEASMYAGTLPLNNGGTYVDGISVLKGYFYAFDGSTYLALVNSPITAPSEASNEWALLARKGHDFSYSDFTPEQISALQKPATDVIDEMTVLKTNVETSEAKRAENEATRVTNEQQRTTDEDTRVTSEATRVTNENGRVESEQARVSAEQARVTDENTRLDAETLRDTQEGQRVANEQQRTTDETARVTAENGRVSAETERASAETTRALAETTRVSNENTRVSNEQARVTAEAGRQATLNAKENSANKQNNLNADGTGTKFPTVDAVNAGLVAKTSIKQTIGTSTTEVMSQKAVTDELAKNNLVAEYIHTTNKEIHCTSLDIATGVFTSAGHGLENLNTLSAFPNMDKTVLPYNVFPAGLLYGGGEYNNYYVRNVTQDTFQLSVTPTGTTITFTSIGDLTSFHFEAVIGVILMGSLPPMNRCEVYIRASLNSSPWFVVAPEYINISSQWMTSDIGGLSGLTYNMVKPYNINLKCTMDFDVKQTIMYHGVSYLPVANTPNTMTQLTVNTCLTCYNPLFNKKFTSIKISPSAGGRGFANGTSIKIYKL